MLNMSRWKSEFETFPLKDRGRGPSTSARHIKREPTRGPHIEGGRARHPLCCFQSPPASERGGGAVSLSDICFGLLSLLVHVTCVYVCMCEQLVLQKRTKPLGEEAPATARSDIFGDAKPQDLSTYEAKKVRRGWVP